MFNRLLDIIHAMVFDEISHRMLEERSTNPKRTCNLYLNPGRYVRGTTDFYDNHENTSLYARKRKFGGFVRDKGLCSINVSHEFSLVK